MNTAEQFTQTIALECQALETIFSKELNNYHNTPALLGKRWYAIGLESIDSEKIKDSSNKGNVIRRMIDAIVGFIRRLVNKIKTFFSGKNNKEKADFSRTYGGPGLDEMVDEMHEYTDRMKRESDETQEELKKSKAAREEKQAQRRAKWEKRVKEQEASESGETLDDVLTEIKETTGQAITKEEAKKITVDARVTQICHKLGKNKQAVLAASLDKNFLQRYHAATKLFDEITHGSPTAENILDLEDKAAEMAVVVGHCNNTIEGMKSKSEEVQLKPIIELVSHANVAYTAWTSDYIMSEASVLLATKYLEALAKLVESLKNETSAEAVESLTVARKILSCLTGATALIGQVSTASNEAATVMLEAKKAAEKK